MIIFSIGNNVDGGKVHGIIQPLTIENLEDKRDLAVTTDFRTVFNEVAEIDYGKTCSYLDIAKRLGDIKNVRAAATANGKNKVAIIVPCHRVIGSDKNLTGYAGGIWRKKWLLQHEFRLSNGIQTLF